ncbi:MAG: alpha/beta fold hydrolase [Acidobacteriota bacterium]|nr:alpha/beta fold hydrolase [Acidobacteriota bacterium]
MKRGNALFIVVLAYLVTLAVSHAVRWRPSPPVPQPGVSFLNLSPPASGETPVRVGYRSWGERSTETPVVALHGSPGSSRDFDTLGPHLGVDRLVLAPDLPGFGSSEKTVPDYSIAAHAEATAAMLDRLGIEEVHVLGFSMGGGVALELAARYPERVRSLTLLSSIGVQELELLGNYFLNHGVHGLQLAGLWALHEAVPHFGALDGFPLDVPYARNFYDTDQRPLRGILERLEMPVSIIHGEHDFLVPPAAAREHHRLVPQSELLMLDDGHFMVFRADRDLAAPISGFLERVTTGRATRRATAAPDRLAAAQFPFDATSVPAAAGVTLAVLLGLIAVATLVSEDATCIATGLLVAQGRLGFLAGSAACAFGILVGDLMIYAAGRFLGRPALERRPLKWLVTPRALARGSAWFARRGPAVIVSSRFLPGTRVATYFSAGLLKTSFWKFLVYFLIAVTAWTPLLVGLSGWLGNRLAETFGAFERWALPGAIGLAVAASLFLKLIRRLSSWSGRRKLLGAIRRKLEWEFWPWWLIYLPLFPWILWQGLRHRSLTLFTAANPGINSGGFVGESKAAILGAIDRRWVARFQKIRATDSPATRLETTHEFLEREALELPVVIKPDVGERGSGFSIARTEGELAAAVTEAAHDLLIQELIGGVELGVFYVRRPGDETGRIFSITEKKLLKLTGDGRSTLEELILRDDRAMRLAPIHLDKMAGELERVPAAGEEIPLVDMGVHSRGALFLDGSRFHTPEMEAAIDEISRSFEGFFFGRYDLRAPSHDAFCRGENLKILELNGVTSEATHIYDPSYSYLAAVRVLRGQWELAFEIGAGNRRYGARPVGIRVLSRLIIRFLLNRR